MIDDTITGFFKEGALLVRLPGGRTLSVGGADETSAPVIVRIENLKTAMAIARNPHLALGEAYMDGGLALERGDVYDLLSVINRNFKYRRLSQAPWAKLWRWCLRRIEQWNARGAARQHVAHHYDLSADLYRRFLDADMQYSCAYFPYPGASLEVAQEAKKRHIADKLVLRPGVRVLDIGSGWGGMALTLAKEWRADVTGVTLSKEQLAIAQKRAAEAGLNDRVRFELVDYRDLVGAYDRIVSVGMFEHVGAPYYQQFFEGVARMLAPDGVALIHTIGRSGPPDRTSAWTRKYIFPGGYIPSMSEILPAVERAGLVVTDIEVLRFHYADTLRAWRERFLAAREEIKKLYDERFCRMWEFYLAGSEASFRFSGAVVFQIQLAKRNDATPITRDYMLAPSGQAAGARFAAE